MTKPVRKASTPSTPVVVDGAGGRHVRHDRVVTEEPMEIRVGGPAEEPRSIAVTMRTPGHDFDLAAGYLWTERIARSRADVREVKYCVRGVESAQLYNIVTVRLAHAVGDVLGRRAAVTSASCGICGTASLDLLEVDVESIDPSSGPIIDAPILVTLPDRLRPHQVGFDQTGGLHAAGVFDATGALLVLREDVGRHNAVDKVIGHELLAGHLPLRDRVLAVSGRTSFEIVQKAATAGIAMIAAVSAPSSLAIDAAERFGITLVGFVRGGTANIYTHPHRVTSPPAPTRTT